MSSEVLRLLVRGYVGLESFLFRIVWTLFQELFVFRGSLVLHSHGIVKRTQTQVRIGHSDGIKLDCCIQITNSNRTFFDLQISLTQKVVSLSGSGLNLYGVR